MRPEVNWLMGNVVLCGCIDGYKCTIYHHVRLCLTGK